MLPPERRLDEVLDLIHRRKFFTLHAGRQTGKTTCLRWLEQHLNDSGEYRAIWVDIETARENPDVKRVMSVVLNMLDRTLSLALPDVPRCDSKAIAEFLQTPETAIFRYLSELASTDPLPWVVLFDEADGLVGEAMVSFLTQLRQGYIERSRSPFPACVVLVGQRQVRDYVLQNEERRAISWLGTTSPFNVTAEAMTLAPFGAEEVKELLEQHTAATGQRFEPEAIALIYELGQGHPWLTNALADQIVRKDVKDRNVPITAAHVEAAKETIIMERRSHIDSLIARLREDRVRRILDPMLSGERAHNDLIDDDFAYVLGLGLIRKSRGQYRVANPIYREVIPRALNYSQQLQISNEPTWYVQKDGSLDMGKLMVDWQKFWRQDGHLAAEGFGYRESGPHLMLMAFLQRVINGGGRIEREYGLGRGALDLIIEWGNERHAVEVKIRRGKRTEADALEQLGEYLERLGLAHGWLILFDLRKLRWEKKLYRRDVEHAGKLIRIIGS